MLNRFLNEIAWSRQASHRMNSSPRLFLTAAFTASTLFLGACSSDDDDAAPAPTDLLGVLGNTPSLSTLNTLVGSIPALANTLAMANDVTIFAPTDAAFTALGQPTIDFLSNPANAAALEEVLEYHAIVGQDLDSTALSALSTVTTAQGSDAFVEMIDGDLYINNARVAMANVTVDNGTVHIIDTVLREPTESLTDSLTTEGFDDLVAAAVAVNLGATLNGSPFTILAPVDGAFDAIPTADLNGFTFDDALLDITNNGTQATIDALTAVLDRHVIQGAGNTALTAVMAGDVASGIMADNQRTYFDLPIAGGGVTVNGVAISSFNRPAMGGLIHAVDDVVPALDTADVAATNAGLTELVDAVNDAGLATAIDEISDGPLTIFAPTNTALMNFETANPNLFLPANQADLATVLQYHIVADAIQSSELATLATVTTLQGDDLTIVVDGMTGAISIDTDPGQAGNINAPVSTADVLTSNAVVHVIDEVLVPPGFVFP